MNIENIFSGLIIMGLASLRLQIIVLILHIVS